MEKAIQYKKRVTSKLVISLDEEANYSARLRKAMIDSKIDKHATAYIFENPLSQKLEVRVVIIHENEHRAKELVKRLIEQLPFEVTWNGRTTERICVKA